MKNAYTKEDIVRLWARKCNESNEGMNEGWVLLDDIYVKYQVDLDGYLMEWAKDDKYEYESIDELRDKYYDDGMYYWTDWEEREYAQMPDGSVMNLNNLN